ncbi:hypothetical protein LOAG_05888 [Loa loa]|uniref:Uncharacterized protein n=1 Tax=Loa loa TaxID=7209 RepID=A0A1S0TZ19_LOALO|nr:hypothetical protein LOAG_05888 [Loa loa]EFO22597.2 hypothetical protein LOAG_05888 [Loa loa]
MSTTTAKEIMPEELPVYTDLSQQFVPFEESDQSATPPVSTAESGRSATPPLTIEENESDEQPENCYDETVNRSPNSHYHRNVSGCEAPKMLEEVKVADGGSGATARISKQFRKRNARRRGGNGLCPPHPPEDVPVVNWSEPSEIKHIFPKTYNYVVYAQARYSSQYLNLSKWRKEFDFFLDKYKYWCDIIQKKQLTDHKEITKAKQLVGQLRWLLDHCWEGVESKSLVPEMLWRARKEETRRCEQLLIRKEYYKREVLMKTAVPSLSRCANANIQKALGRYDDDRSCSLKDNTMKLSSMFQRKTVGQAEIDDNVIGLSESTLSNKIEREEEQEDDLSNFWKERGQIIKKKAHLFSVQFLVRRWAGVLKHLQTPSGIMRSLFDRNVMQNRLEQYVQDLAATYEKIKDSDDFDEQIIHVLLRRDVLLKEELCDNGLESLTNNWIIFESKSPKAFKKKLDKEMSSREPSKSPEKFSSSNTSSTLLKVRDYLDDDVKSATTTTSNSRTGQVKYDPSEVTNMMQLAATRDNGASMSGRSGLTARAEIPRPVAIKPSNLTEDEKNRLELQEVVAVEGLWAAFAKTETPKFKDDKPILDAIEAVLNSCRSYRAVLEVPLPKTLADLRRNVKFRKIHEAVALLQALIIQRHEAKTGRRVDLTLFETPEIRRLRTQFAPSAAVYNSNPAVSVGPTKIVSQISSSSGAKFSENDIKQELDGLPPKKKQKQLDGKVTESGKNELGREAKLEKIDGGIEMLTTNRPKRNIKAPQRFIFDDEEKEEEKKKKTMTRERTKTAKGNSSKIIEKLKNTSQHTSSRKGNREKKADSSATSMELSNMETIVVIPEDDNMDINDRNYWPSNTDDGMLLDLDLVDVTAEHEFKCECDGIVRDVFRYIGTWKNGTAKKVSRRVYELWTNRKIAGTSGQVTTEENKSKETESTTEQQRSISPEIVQQKQISSTDLLTYPDDNGSSNQLLVNHNSVSSIYSNDSSNRLSNTGPCSSQNIASRSTSGEQNEDGDCGPWRQVAFRKEASLSGPAKMDKLKTQYDHLLMISEKNYVEKLYSEWMYVPEGGPFDDRIKHIRQFIQELEDVLKQPNSTWRDYFNMKKYLQTLIDNVMVDFSALSGQAASPHLLLTSDTAFSSSRSTMSDVGRDNADISIRPNSN